MRAVKRVLQGCFVIIFSIQCVVHSLHDSLFIVQNEQTNSTTAQQLHQVCTNTNHPCYLGPDSCKYTYKHTVTGISGTFTTHQLQCLQQHFSNSTYFIENDMPVFKTEDETMFYPLQPSTTRHLLQDFDGNASIFGGSVNVFALSQGIQLNAPIEKKQTVSPILWNLDRIDQTYLPLDGQFTYGNANDPGIGEGSTIYVLDSGVMKEHQEFIYLHTAADLQNNNNTTNNTSNSMSTTTTTTSTTSSRVSYGWNFIDNSPNCTDIDGHGSHVAGVAAGVQVGIAKGANIVAVRVLDGNGSGTVSTTVAGLEWVIEHHKKPAVVTLSLGVQQGSYSKAMENAIRSAINDHGIVVVVAAGNADGDACAFSPALVAEALTVAASGIVHSSDGGGDSNGSNGGAEQDEMYPDGNQGQCVDIIAPGMDIYSVCGGPRRCGNVGRDTYALATGTSMAVPHVAGVAALIVAKYPYLSPQQVADVIIKSASQGKFASGDELKSGTPNRVLYASNYSSFVY